ncbi:60S ribosomal protein L22 [Lemmus lemmus]
MAPMKKLVAKGREKKAGLKFTLGCICPIEDGTTDAANSKQLLQERSKVNGKAGDLGRRAVAIKWSKSKIIVTPEVPFSKRLLKYLTKKILAEQSPRLCSCCHQRQREL